MMFVAFEQNRWLHEETSTSLNPPPPLTLSPPSLLSLPDKHNPGYLSRPYLLWDFLAQKTGIYSPKYTTSSCLLGSRSIQAPTSSTEEPS